MLRIISLLFFGFGELPILSDVIDLLQCISFLDKSSNSRRGHQLPTPQLSLTSLERHLLKGALPHCVEAATIRPNVLKDFPKEDEKNIGNDPTPASLDAAPVSVPINCSPPLRKTPLISFSTRGHIIGVPEVIIVHDVVHPVID